MCLFAVFHAHEYFRCAAVRGHAHHAFIGLAEYDSVRAPARAKRLGRATNRQRRPSTDRTSLEGPVRARPEGQPPTVLGKHGTGHEIASGSWFNDRASLELRHRPEKEPSTRRIR